MTRTTFLVAGLSSLISFSPVSPAGIWIEFQTVSSINREGDESPVANPRLVPCEFCFAVHRRLARVARKGGSRKGREGVSLTIVCKGFDALLKGLLRGCGCTVVFRMYNMNFHNLLSHRFGLLPSFLYLIQSVIDFCQRWGICFCK